MPYQFRFDVVWANKGFLLSGVVMTLYVTLAALSIGVVAGLIVGIARMSTRRRLKGPALGYVEARCSATPPRWCSSSGCTTACPCSPA
jgi:ABC-type amino acid transport system permease subunit